MYSRSTLLLVLLLTSAIDSFPQSGYVVNLRGDTLRGRIVLEPQPMIDRLQIRTDDRKHHLTAREVRSISIDEQAFKSVAYDNKIRFMKVLSNGYMSLLSYRSSHTNFTFDSYLLVMADGRMMDVPRLSFKKDMPDLIDQPGLADSIASGKLGLADLETIISSYNRNVEQKTRVTSARNKAISANEPALYHLRELSKKVELLDFNRKNEALEILRDIDAKLSAGNHAPEYALRALQDAVANQSELAAVFADWIRQLKTSGN